MIDFLELYKGIKINLRLRPGPKKIPASLKVHTMRKLKPALSSIKGCIDDVINFGFVFDYSIKKIIFLFLFKVVFG
jgi:hypothetical protein